MKIAILALLLSATGLAAQVNLNGGDVVIIDANTRTTVSCGNAGNGNGYSSDCAAAAAGFHELLLFCYKSYTGGECARTLWPKYKAANPSCIYAAASACLEYCFKSLSGGECANFCQ